MHPDTQRDVDQKVNAGLITLMDAKIINKYLAEARIIRGSDLSLLFSDYQFLKPWADTYNYPMQLPKILSINGS